MKKKCDHIVKYCKCKDPSVFYTVCTNCLRFISHKKLLDIMATVTEIKGRRGK